MPDDEISVRIDVRFELTMTAAESTMFEKYVASNQAEEAHRFLVDLLNKTDDVFEYASDFRVETIDTPKQS